MDVKELGCKINLLILECCLLDTLAQMDSKKEIMNNFFEHISVFVHTEFPLTT
jgi:hypothetical protein